MPDEKEQSYPVGRSSLRLWVLGLPVAEKTYSLTVPSYGCYQRIYINIYIYIYVCFLYITLQALLQAMRQVCKHLHTNHLKPLQAHTKRQHPVTPRNQVHPRPSQGDQTDKTPNALNPIPATLQPASPVGSKPEPATSPPPPPPQALEALYP